MSDRVEYTESPICSTCGTMLTEENRTRPDILKCPACGREKVSPSKMSQELVTKLNMAHRERRNHHFDDAYDIYREILSDDKNNVDAQWGLLLNHYGVVDVLEEGRYIPTVSRFSSEKVNATQEYKSLVKMIKPGRKKYFEEQVEYIEEVRQGIENRLDEDLNFDVFICYKRSVKTEHGELETKDSKRAAEIYRTIDNAGYETFFAEETLDNNPGANWEALIYTALHSAKVMILLCSREDYLNAPWVKNEWSRFLKLAEQDPDKKLYTVQLDGFNPNRLPHKISSTKPQLISMERMDFREILLGNLSKDVTKLTGMTRTSVERVQRTQREREQITVQQRQVGKQVKKQIHVSATVEKQMANIENMYMKNRKFKKAIMRYTEIIKDNPDLIEAYWGRLLATSGVQSIGQLRAYNIVLSKTKSDFEAVMSRLEERDNKYIKEYQKILLIKLRNLDFDLDFFDYLLSWKDEPLQVELGRIVYNELIQVHSKKRSTYKYKDILKFEDKYLKEILYHTGKILPEKDTDIYLNRYTNTIGRLIKESQFDTAKSLLKEVYKIDPLYGPAKEKEFLIMYGARNYTDVVSKINDLKFEALIKEMLSAGHDIIKQANALFEVAFDRLSKKKIDFGVKVFDKIVEYIPEKNVDYLKEKMNDFITELLNLGKYSMAEKYVDHFLSEDPTNDYYHWLKFKIDRKTPYELDLLLDTKKDLLEYPDFENALNSAKDNSYYIKFYEMHEKLNKDRRLKRKLKKHRDLLNESSAAYIKSLDEYVKRGYSDQLKRIEDFNTHKWALRKVYKKPILFSIGIFLIASVFATSLYWVEQGYMNWIMTYSFGGIWNIFWAESGFGAVLAAIVLIVMVIIMVADMGIGEGGVIAGVIGGAIGYIILAFLLTVLVFLLCVILDLWMGLMNILPHMVAPILLYGVGIFGLSFIMKGLYSDWLGLKYSTVLQNKFSNRRAIGYLVYVAAAVAVLSYIR